MKFPERYDSVLLKKGVVSIEKVDFPTSKVNENSLVIKPFYMGICRADVKEVVGSRDIPEDRGPLFGHEFVGEVVHAGKETGFEADEIVTFNPNITPNRTTGFAEYFFIEGGPETLHKAVIRINKSLTQPIWQPEPFACIVHSVEKLLEHSGWPNFEGKKAAVIGSGNSGTMFGLYIKYLVGEVTVFNRGKMRRDYLIEKALFQDEAIAPLEKVPDYKNNFDVVIVVPTKINNEVLSDAFALTNNQGYMLLYGGTQKDDTFLDSDTKIDSIRREELSEQVNYEGKEFYITGAYGCSKEDFENGLMLYREQNSSFPLHKLVSKEINLTEFPELITKMATGVLDYPGKVIVKP